MTGGENGSSPITAVVGIAIVLGFMLLSSQALVHLYATSVVTSVTFAAARAASSEQADCDRVSAGGVTVEQYVRHRLGPYGAGASVVCVDDGTWTSVTIRAPSPARALRASGRLAQLDEIVRTAHIRSEQAP